MNDNYKTIRQKKHTVGNNASDAADRPTVPVFFFSTKTVDGL